VKEVYFFPFHKDVCVEEVSDFFVPRSPYLLQKIDEIIKRNGKKIWDSKVLVMRSYNKEKILVGRASYRECFACICDPSLRKELQLYPLAICARTIWNKKILLSLRSKAVATDQNVWECIPSGGIDETKIGLSGKVDVQAALLQEFLEETKFSYSSINTIETTGLIWTISGGVFDLCFDIKLHEDAILPVSFTTEESSKVCWVGHSDCVEPMLPSSKVLVRLPFS
jgi:hypothetical protein